jgi:RimJ/RimL family protein N-acetyltransferase
MPATLKPWSFFNVSNDIKWFRDPDIRALNPPCSNEYGVNETFAIYDENDVHIGLCSLHNMTDTSAELGIVIGDKSCWNRGYGQNVVKQLIVRAFDLGKKRVWLTVLSSNTRAIACYSKCGFRKSGEIIANNNMFDIMEIRQ